MKKKRFINVHWLLFIVCLTYNSQKAVAQKSVTVTNGTGSQEVLFTKPVIDFSENAFLTVDVTNNSSSEIAVKIWYWGEWKTKINEGLFIVPANQTKQGRIIWYRPSVAANSPWHSIFPNVRGLPGNHKLDWRAFDQSLLQEVKIKVYWENHTGGNQSVTIGEPYASGDYSFPAIDFNALSKPFFDIMGQYVHDNWDMKLGDKSELQTLAAEDLILYEGASFDTIFSQYGGYIAGGDHDGTGYFRTEKINGKWWLIDPDGYLFWSNGVTGARSGSATSTAGRESYFPTFNDESSIIQAQAQGGSIDFYNINVIRKYGEDWKTKLEAVTYGRMKSWGLNTIGSWASAPDKVMHPFAVVVWHQTINMPGITRKQVPDPWSPEFLSTLRGSLHSLSQDWKDSPWLIGVYTGNEMGWFEEIDIPRAVLQLTNSTPARKALEDFFSNKYNEDIQKLNNEWGTNYSSFQSLAWNESRYNASKTMQNDLDVYLKHYADTYFSTCRDEIDNYLPNHLYLGCRIHKASFDNIIVKNAASRYCDVVSYNLYAHDLNDLVLDLEVDKPCIIGEYSFGRGSHGVWGYGNGAHASDLQNQAESFKYFVKSAVEHPNFVGTHWFQFVDQMASGRAKDGENYGIGFVNITDQPYQPLVDAIKETSNKMYEWRIGETMQTSIEKQPEEKAPDIKIYPNPNDGVFYVDTNNLNQCDLSIYTITGQKVYETKFQGSKNITLPEVLNGVYLLKVENSGEIISKRMLML